MKVNLICPPLWECDLPYSSIAYLSSYLKQNGYTVRCCDLNIEIQNYILSDKGIEEAVNKLNLEILRSEGEKNDYLRKIYSLYELVGKDKILEAVSALKETSDMRTINRAKRICEIGRYVYSAPYYPAYFDSNRYEPGIGEVNNVNTLIEAIEDRGKNIFYTLFEKYADSHIDKFDVWGITVASSNQLVPAFTLAEIIKSRHPDKKIVIGGAILPYMYTAVLNSPELFRYADCFIFGEGETPLLKWLGHLEKSIALEQVPNIMYLKDGLVKTTLEQSIENINSLDTPDYEGTAWGSYFSSQNSISYVSSRGCYWNKCSFLGLTSNYSQMYRIRDIKLVLEDIGKLVNLWGVRYINFNDEALSPGRLKQLAEGIRGRNLEFYWTCLCRPDAGMDRDLFELCYKAGLRIISFGLESVSGTLLQKRNKDFHSSDIPNILRSSHEAGIWNNIYLIAGFPDETENDIPMIKQFLKENIEYIDSLGYGCFRPEGYSQVGKSQVGKSQQNFGTGRKNVNIKYFGTDYPISFEREQPLMEKINASDKSIRHSENYPVNFFSIDLNNLFILTGKYSKKEIWDRYFNDILSSRRNYDIYMENNADNLLQELNKIACRKMAFSKSGLFLLTKNPETGVLCLPFR